MLGGIGLLLMQRLRRASSTQSFFGTELLLAQVQLVWLLHRPDDRRRCSPSRPLRRLAAAATSTRGRRSGIALLLATFVLGSDVNGARLTLSIGPLPGSRRSC